MQLEQLVDVGMRAGLYSLLRQDPVQAATAMEKPRWPVRVYSILCAESFLACCCYSEWFAGAAVAVLLIEQRGEGGIV